MGEFLGFVLWLGKILLVELLLLLLVVVVATAMAKLVLSLSCLWTLGADEIGVHSRVINLTKNSQFFVRQGDVERLIAQGFLQKLS